MCVCHLKDVVGTLPAQVVLTWQDDHRLAEDLQTDGTDELLLQTLHEEEEPRSRSNPGEEAARWRPAALGDLGLFLDGQTSGVAMPTCHICQRS